MGKKETFALVIVVAILIGLATYHSLERKKPCVCPPMTAERSKEIIDNAAFIGKVRVLDVSHVHYYETLMLRLQLVSSYKNQMDKYAYSDGDNTFDNKDGLFAAANAYLQDGTTECLSEIREGETYEVILQVDAKFGYTMFGPCDQPLAADWEKLRSAK